MPFTNGRFRTKLRAHAFPGISGFHKPVRKSALKGNWCLECPGCGRVNLWIAERHRQEREADEAAERAAESNAIEHPRVSRVPEGWAVRTPYDPALTELLRGLPGARWDAGVKRWIVPARATEALRAILPRLTALAAEAEIRAAGQARERYRVRSSLRW